MAHKASLVVVSPSSFITTPARFGAEPELKKPPTLPPYKILDGPFGGKTTFATEEDWLAHVEAIRQTSFANPREAVRSTLAQRFSNP